MPHPKGWYDEFEIYRDNEETVVEVQELAKAEYRKIGFHLLVHGELDGDLPPPRVDHELTLSEDDLFGETYAAHGGTALNLNQL